MFLDMFPMKGQSGPVDELLNIGSLTEAIWSNLSAVTVILYDHLRYFVFNYG